MEKQKITVLSVIIAVLFVTVLYLIFNNFNKPVYVVNRLPTPTNYPTITPSSTIPVPTATGDLTAKSNLGFSLQYPKNWSFSLTQNTLISHCNKIIFTKSDAVQLELPIVDYVKQQWGPTANIIQMINEMPEKYKISFRNILPSSVIVLGPQGVGEENNLYIRGPEGTGYYNISVAYIGPSTGDTSVCLGKSEDEYKQILSTFKFTQSVVTAKEACMANKSFQWSTKWNECYDVSYNQTEIQKLGELCRTYKGVFNPTANSCRHVVVTDTNPCGPEAVAVCSL